MSNEHAPEDVSRRSFIKRGSVMVAGAVGAATLLSAEAKACSTCKPAVKGDPPPSPNVVVGQRMHTERVVNMDTAGALPPIVGDPPDPTAFLTHFDTGKVTKLPDGRTLREYVLVASEHDVMVSPGISFPAWTFNKSLPGPTIRCTEGDLLRIHFYNHSGKDHTAHFHGIHPAVMDGAFEIVPPGGYYRYEFTAEPFGCLAYHCHMAPLRKHFSRGMYGAFIIDPIEPREPALEMVMVMHGFDTDMTNEANAFYAVNGPAFAYRDRPIEIPVDQLIRLYLVNMTEIDLLNSFHLHGNFFKLFRSGTRTDFYEFTDTVMLCQGERAILEFKYKHAGDFLFHSHQNEFAERGWLGIFRVV
ncbi:MAG: multicopper oxidase domain-containing protein [Fimbriimonadaceae bacterium]